jgi:hypothetical protein
VGYAARGSLAEVIELVAPAAAPSEYRPRAKREGYLRCRPSERNQPGLGKFQQRLSNVRSIRSFDFAVQQLDRQVHALTNRGVDVVVVEPTVAMGVNLMDARRWAAVFEAAMISVAAQLRCRHVKTRLGALHSAA